MTGGRGLTVHGGRASHGESWKALNNRPQQVPFSSSSLSPSGFPNAQAQPRGVSYPELGLNPLIDGDEPDGGISDTVEPGSDYNSDPDNGVATVTVADDDLPEHLPAADLLLSPTGMSSGSASLMVSSGGSISYSITLSSPPGAALTLSDGEVVTVSIRAEGATITIEPTQLTFTTRNWNVPQRVRAPCRRPQPAASP